MFSARQGLPLIGFRTLLPIVLLLISSFVSAQQVSRAMSAADSSAFKHALDLQDQGKAGEAEPILKSLAGRYPNSFEISESLGLLYAEAGKVDTALPLLEKAAKLSPKSAIAQANLGAAYAKLNKPEEAVRVLQRAAALDPQNPETQSSLGTALMQVHQSRQAALAFGKAVQKKSEDADLRYNWAVALLDSGETAKAKEVLLALPNKDSQPQVQVLLGEIAEKQGQFKEAAERMEAAAKLEPSEPNVYALGMEFLQHWTFDPAIKIFQYGVGLYPNSTRMLLGLGIARYATNDLTASAPIFGKLLDQNPDSDLYADLLGRSCGLMPESSAGCEKLEGFALRHPKNATVATYAAASILHRPKQSQDLPSAEKLLDQAIAADPNLAEAHFQKGILLQYQSHWKESVSELERSIDLKPDYSKAHYRLALAYSHVGQRDKAQEQIALQKKYSEEEKDELNARFKEVKTFLVNMQ